MYTPIWVPGTGINLRNILKKLLIFFLYILDIIVPKNKKLVVAASSHGQYIFGSPRALFNYINSDKTDYSCIYLVKSKKLTDIKNDIYYLYSLKGLLAYLQSSYVLMTHGRVDYYLLSDHQIEAYTHLYRGNLRKGKI